MLPSDNKQGQEEENRLGARAEPIQHYLLLNKSLFDPADLLVVWRGSQLLLVVSCWKQRLEQFGHLRNQRLN